MRVLQIPKMHTTTTTATLRVIFSDELSDK